MKQRVWFVLMTLLVSCYPCYEVADQWTYATGTPSAPGVLDDIEQGIYPLYVPGDLNFDYTINNEDLEIFEGKGEKPVCDAAADLTGNGVVNDHDKQMLLDLLGYGDSISSLPLYGQPTLGCDYSKSLLASRLDASPGDSIPIRLIGAGLEYNFDDIKIDLSYGSLKYKPDYNGWDIEIPEDAPDSVKQVDIQFTFSDKSLLWSVPLYIEERPDSIFTGLAAPEPTVRDDGDDEEETDCPSRGKGCEALVLDFSYNTWTEYDSDDLADALRDVGCSTDYVALYFKKLPSVWKAGIGSGDYRISFQWGDSSEVKRVIRDNKRQWDVVHQAVVAHARKLGSGRELGIQVINGHGGKSGEYGTWGPGFYTGRGGYSRALLHYVVYIWAKKNVCSNVVYDMSCYSGLTPKCVYELNNVGSNTGASPSPDCLFHAGYEYNSASGTSPADEPATNGEVGNHNAGIIGVIQGEISLRKENADAGIQPRDFAGLTARLAKKDNPQGESLYADPGYFNCVPPILVKTGF